MLVAALAAALALAAGCTAGRIDPTRVPAENLKAEDLATALWEDGEDLRTFAMRGEATYRSGNSSSFFRFELVCERPASFLFTAFDPFGSPAFRIASSEGRLTAADYPGKAFFTGSTRDGALGLLVPVPLEPPELLAALSGSLPFPPVRAEAAAPLPESEGTVVFLAYPSGGGIPLRVQLRGAPPWNSASGKTLQTVSRGPANSPELTVRYGPFRENARDDRGGALRSFPHSLSAAWRQGGNRALDISYTEVSLGFAVPPGIFGLERPAGFSLETI
jgi:hypothetical protein